MRKRSIGAALTVVAASPTDRGGNGPGGGAHRIKEGVAAKRREQPVPPEGTEEVAWQ